MNINETLQDVLDQVSDDTVLYIGAGGAFFFIGTKKEYEEDIPYIEDEFKRQTSNRIVWAKRRIEVIDKDNPNLDAASRDNVRKIYYDALKRKEDQIFPLTSRKVVSVYKKKLKGEKGYAVVIDGFEVGHCWLRHEYKRPYKGQYSDKLYFAQLEKMQEEDEI